MFVLCIPSDDIILRPSCVVYFLMVEKVESLFWASPAGVNYIRAVPSCSPLFYAEPLSGSVPSLVPSPRIVVAGRFFHHLIVSSHPPSRYLIRFA